MGLFGRKNPAEKYAITEGDAATAAAAPSSPSATDQDKDQPGDTQLHPATPLATLVEYLYTGNPSQQSAALSQLQPNPKQPHTCSPLQRQLTGITIELSYHPKAAADCSFTPFA